MTSRRRTAISLAVLGCLGIGAGGLLGVELLQLGLGNKALEAERADRAEEHYSSAAGLAIVEAWVPLFDRGVARHHLARWEAAADDYRRASTLAPESARCMIHLNWAETLEAGGDELAASDDLGGALAHYQEAQLVLGLAECPSTSSSLSQLWSSARERLHEKQGASPPAPEPEPEEGDERDDALRQREQQAAEQRARAEQRGDPSDAQGEQRTW